MSIDVLISGRLRGVPSPRTAANGSPYLLFRVAAIDKTGESLLCGRIAFADSVIQAVQALGEGDSRYGLDVTAHGVLTAYHIGRKRKASAGDESTDE